MSLELVVVIGLIALAAFVDVFFLTGIWFSGTFVLIIVGTAYARGDVTFWTIIPVTFVVTLLTNYGNFLLGKHGSHIPIINRQLDKPHAEAFRQKIESLSPKSLFGTMFVARFVGVIRPFYALVLGASNVNTARFLYNETILALAWTLAWSLFVYAVTNVIIALV